MNHQAIFRNRIVARRELLGLGGMGLGGLALTSLLASDRPPIRPVIDSERPYAARPPHFVPRARRVLMVFCTGALSHVDSFDYKPELLKRHDTPMPGQDRLVTFQGENGNLIKPLWEFRPRGQSGKMTSELLPCLGELADELCFIHSMTGKSNTHGPAESQMSTGYILDGFPSMGAWVTYALGSEGQNLPAYVAIPDPRGVPQISTRQWASAFLPAAYQGTPFNADKPIANLARPASISEGADVATRDLVKFLNDRHLAQHPGGTELSARIASYELAARMQLAAAEVGDTRGESAATLALYGVDDPNRNKAGFAKNCLLARRLLERGVRFVQLFNGAYAMGRASATGMGTKPSPTNIPVTRTSLISPAPRFSVT